MKLELRMRKSINNLSGTIIFRSDVASLGSPSQISYVLNLLLKKGELIRVAHGIYAKPELKTNNNVNIGTIIDEIADKLGIELSCNNTTFTSDKIIVETKTPQISRKITIAGKHIWFRSIAQNNELSIPTKNVARYVQNLANRFNVTYAINSMDLWANTVTQLAGDNVQSDHTEDLIVALKRAGKITQYDVAALTLNHLREKKQKNVRSF